MNASIYSFPVATFKNLYLVALRMIDLAILISGRGSNMDAILTAVQSGKIKNVNPAVVISDRLDAPGLKIASEKYNVPAEVVSGSTRGWSYDEQIVSLLKHYGVLPRSGLVCLAGFMRIISAEFLALYKMRMINIHPSLLPSFHGLHAQRQALDYGVKFSGCTVHFLDEGVDSGPIILQQPVEVLEKDTEETLSARILDEEHIIYPEAVRLFAEGRLKVDGRKVIVES